MNGRTPVTLLNDMMTKLLIVPKYEVIHGGPGEFMFMMRVTCPMSKDGDDLSACGSYGRSKQEAKHNAALAFLKKYCNGVDIAANYVGLDTSCTGCDKLLGICATNNLGPPEYIDLYMGGSGQSPIWVVECKVSHISVEGRGSRKTEAKEEAAARMILILTATKPVLEILKSTKPTKPASNYEIVSCKDDPKGCRDVCLSSNVSVADTPRVCRKADTTKELVRLLNEMQVAEKMKKNLDDSETNASVTEL